MIRRVSSEGVGYSVADLNDVRHVFAAAVPRSGETFADQAADTLATIRAVIDEEGAKGSIVKQTVFLRDAQRMGECREIMRDFHGDDLPATTYVPQAPCQGKHLSIEALGVGRRPGEVEIHRVSEHVVVAQHHGTAWIHCDQVIPQTRSPRVYERSLDAFARMKGFLVEAGARFDQIVRTWLYLGDIVGLDDATQRYMELNRARSDFFQGIRFGDGRAAASAGRAVYPASTGIGADGSDVLMSSIALATDRDDVRLVPLENPRQTAAFDYAPNVSPRSPKFSRAMAVVAGSVATIFISGTASITDSTSRHAGDVRRQTQQTLENIADLVSGENLARHGMAGCRATLDDLALVRVYVKRREDFEAAREVCRARLGELPTVFAVADVCRPELLVEIEGVAFATR
ncbi:MAG: dioxygenase [Pirellulales bacterium]|nr:dioxygenase [Pirellulales bacterium]